MAFLTFNTAMRLLTQNNPQAVYDLAVGALRENDKNPLAFFFLGIVASDHGQHAKALELFAKAAEHGPRNARYQAYYAKALSTVGLNSDAKSQADVAAKLGTTDAFVADIIGTVYSRTGHHKLAVPFYKRAAKINPKWPIFQYNLAASAQFTGDKKTARNAYLRAVGLDPKFYRAWFSLVSLETQTADNNHLAALKDLFAGAGADPDAQLLLGHSIAKTLEDMKKYPESLEWLGKAKAARKMLATYDQSRMNKMFEAAENTFKSSPVANAPEAEITPIFVVGLPRTGTTLVDRILSSHASVISAGEIDLFAQIVEAQTQISRQQGAETFAAAQAADLAAIGKIYAEAIKPLANGASHFIDKTPMNFLYAGLIQKALPNARIIVLRRGAMDSCLSNYRQLFALHDPRFGYAHDLEDCAAFYRAFDALMTHAREVLPPSRFLEVRYEDIVSDQEAQTRRLLEFCDLEWDAACLSFHENKAPVDTASSVQVRQPLYSGSVGRWEKYGDGLAALKAALGDLAET